MNFKLIAVFLMGLLLWGCVQTTNPQAISAADASTKVVVNSTDPVIVAAGDIACDPADSKYNEGKGTDQNCRMKATSDLFVDAKLAAVLPLGDLQYSDGKLAKFQESYHPTWGRVKKISYPVPGNHEYYNQNADGYFSYFGAAAGDRTKGYYSYNLGKWHLIALNSNCEAVEGCGIDSPQEKWLKADLAKNKTKCTLAYWHHPRFSSGPHGNAKILDVFWQDLYNAGVEVILNGHDHDYERFAPQNPSGVVDAKKGIREFVIGSGGSEHYRLISILDNSEVRNQDTFGVLQLTLHPTSYEWRFVPESGKKFTDSGSESCH